MSLRSGSHSEMSPLPLEEARPNVSTDVQSLLDEEEEALDEAAGASELALELLVADLTFSSEALREKELPLPSRLCESESDLSDLGGLAEGVEALRGAASLPVDEEEEAELLAGDVGAEEGVEEDLCESVVVGELSLIV